MTEAEFHGKRQMWAIKDDHIVIAPVGFPYSHFEWFCGMFGGPDAARHWIMNAVRGYYLDNRIVAYKGETFEHVGCQPEAVAKIIKIFDALHGPVTEVGFGVFAEGSEQPWLPRILFPTSDFLASVERRRERRVTAEPARKSDEPEDEGDSC